jgi:hypothetical protein
MYICILNLIIINLNFITMRKIFTLILAFTFIFGGLANAQQLKSIAKAKASVNAVANTNAEIGAFKMNGEKPAEKPATGKQVKLNSLLGSGAKATTVYSEDFTGGMGGWTVVGLGDGSWSVKDESNAGGTAPELMLEWVSGSDFDGQSYCMSPVINTTGYTTLALEFKQWFRNYQGSSVLGVYTTIDDGATWEEVWSETVSANFVEVKNLLITNAHVGNANFRIAFGFNGNTFDIWEWAIDDILLVEPDAHDLGIVNITPSFVAQGFTVTPKVVVQNFGTNDETTWSLTLTDGGTYTSTKSDVLINSGDNLVVDMDAWTPTDGTYTLTATITLADDGNSGNDTKTIDVYVGLYPEDAYALNANDETYNVVNLADGSFTYLGDVTTSPFPMSEEFDGNYIYRVYGDFTYGIVDPFGGYTQIGTMTGVDGTPTGLAYNWNNGLMYVMVLNSNNLPQLCTVDLTTGALTLIGTGTEGMMIAMDFANDGLIYAVSLNPDNLYSIDPATGTVTSVGPLGININYGQDASYDPVEERLYTYTCGDVYQFGYYDLTTGAFTSISNTPGDAQIATFVVAKSSFGPHVVALAPVADAIDVALDAAVSVTFDVNLTEVDLTGITITPDPGNVSASINNAVLTIAHDDFAYNTTYTVLVPAGAVSDGVDATTHPITWSFKTMLDPAACNTPTNLIVSNIQETEATVTWTEVGAGTQWRVKYGATGFNPETEGEEKVVDVQTATLTELTANTTYEVYVQALCPGDATSDWAGPASFTTACAAITTLPYLEEFEGAFPTECWTFVNNHADPTSNWHIDNDQDTGDPALNILWSDENMMDEWAISPVFDLSGITGEIALTFDFLMSYYYQVDPTNGADVMVKVTTDNGTTWTKIWQEEDYGTFENWTWYTATLPFSTYVGESNVKFAFHYLGNDGAQVMIDNVELDYATSVNDNVTNLVSVYPNPSNGIVNVQVSETSVITIVDLAGRVVATYNANANETLSFTQAAGVYVVKVESNGQVSNHKLIIQ